MLLGGVDIPHSGPFESHSATGKFPTPWVLPAPPPRPCRVKGLYWLSQPPCNNAYTLGLANKTPMTDLASRREHEEAGAAQDPFWEKDLGHSVGFWHPVANINGAQVWCYRVLAVDTPLEQHPQGEHCSRLGGLQDQFSDFFLGDSVVYIIPCSVKYNTLSFHEFCSSCANVFLTSEPSGLASSESQPTGKTSSLN